MFPVYDTVYQLEREGRGCEEATAKSKVSRRRKLSGVGLRGVTGGE